MKINFKNIIAVFAIASVFAACSRKIEYQTVPYVSVDHTSYTVEENVGEISIPVNVYNTNGQEVTVAVKTLDNTAVIGTDYEIVSPASGILTFSGDKTTEVVKVAVKSHEGVYTGNMRFGIQINCTTEGVVNGGYTQSVVTIKDLDHPLSSILGAYTVTAAGPGIEAPFTMTLTPDEEDVTVVWADVVCPFVIDYPSYNWDVYGVVSDDKTTITFPYLQELEAGYFVGTNSSYSIIEKGEVVFELQEDGTWTTDDPYMIYAGALYYGSIVMNASMTKN